MLSELTIKTMLELNPELKKISNEELEGKKSILKNINCSDNEIINIISSNPIFLSRTNEEITNLIDYLKNKGFKSLNVLFESNPYILNLEIFEIEEYINNRFNNSENLDEIIDDLESNPYLFNEF